MTIIKIAPSVTALDAYRSSIQAHLDEKARERGYDSGHTIATYVNSTVAAWATEAQAYVEWRDTVWMFAFSELEKVQNLERTPPSPAEFCQELPSLIWP